MQVSSFGKWLFLFTLLISSWSPATTTPPNPTWDELRHGTIDEFRRALGWPNPNRDKIYDFVRGLKDRGVDSTAVDAFLSAWSENSITSGTRTHYAVNIPTELAPLLFALIKGISDVNTVSHILRLISFDVGKRTDTPIRITSRWRDPDEREPSCAEQISEAQKLQSLRLDWVVTLKGLLMTYPNLLNPYLEAGGHWPSTR